MNKKLIPTVWVYIAITVLPAADDSAAVTKSKQELDALVAQIQQKLRAGEKSAAQLAPEAAAFADLRAKYADAEPAVAANIVRLEYSFLRDVVKDPAKAAELKPLLATKYRQHIEGTRAGQQIAGEEKAEQLERTQKALIGKPAPELTFKWSTQPELKKLSDLRGKVVVLDFWTTWCGPCIRTFPELHELSAHYKDDDVVVLGITSLQGRVSNLKPMSIDTKNNPESEFALTAEFIKAKNMTWPVVFSEQRVFNPEYGVGWIPHVAIVAPDGTVRHPYVESSVPPAKKRELIDELLREFGKPRANRSTDN